MINVSTKCQTCGEPMVVECDDSLPANEKFVSMATCDGCLIRMGRMERPKATAERTYKLPYPKD